MKLTNSTINLIKEGAIRNHFDLYLADFNRTVKAEYTDPTDKSKFVRLTFLIENNGKDTSLIYVEDEIYNYTKELLADTLNLLPTDFIQKVIVPFYNNIKDLKVGDYTRIVDSCFVDEGDWRVKEMKDTFAVLQNSYGNETCLSYKFIAKK